MEKQLDAEELRELADSVHRPACRISKSLSCDCGLDKKVRAALREYTKWAPLLPEVGQILDAGQRLGKRLGIGLGQSILKAIPDIMQRHAEMVERERVRTRMEQPDDIGYYQGYLPDSASGWNTILWNGGQWEWPCISGAIGGHLITHWRPLPTPPAEGGSDAG